MAIIASVTDIFVFASNLDVFGDGLTSSVVSNMLRWITDSEVLLILAAVKLHERHTVATIETRMISGAELIILIDNIFKLRSKGFEGHSELSLLLLHVHQ